ncbi:PREDICTED: ENHANCER OF AG-4 protein 2-like isoform X2 [Nelumbo nucifera]|uniref:ENHANCER OF AG-4 protein 2-like isoform X2 n=2 Tax=Nelumbo nucifera TaxID=4432 RepID=A0A1U7ZPK1_NELNU|nr:PREDICTED: ENHANCER OF AG-4 protein 2-like isoform X2 [Nelumbo nucifera]DAD36005.1 TPA_asm: hypothetical protein HUJ06_006645 [Nelumbo nucifera]
MAPGRKKGANRAKANQLSLGDLVLAKVKGFPAWPAKISRPEDWERTPDPKKYFVQFFGTAEIAFVAPADIQAFTNEAKSKLSARCQGKTVKDFARAVKEICEAFEELQQKKAGGSGADTDKTALDSVASSIDGGVAELNDQIQTDIHNQISGGEASADDQYGLEQCSHRGDETEKKDIKPSISCNKEPSLSPVLSIKRRDKTSNGAHIPKKEAPPTSKPDNPYPLKEESGKVETHSKGSSSSRSSHLLNQGDSLSCLVDDNDGLPCLDGSVSAKQSTGGQKAKKVVSVLKRRRDGAVDVRKRMNPALKSLKRDNPDSHLDLPESGEHLKDGVQSKSSPCDNKKESSPDTFKSDSDISNKKKAKGLPRVNKHLMGGDKPLGLHDSCKGTLNGSEGQGKDELLSLGDHRKKRSHLGHSRHKLPPGEDSDPTKRIKHVDVSGSTTKKSLFKRSESPGSAVVGDTGDKHGETKTFTSFLKEENHLPLSSETFSVQITLPGDEDILPPTKRRRRALEAMSDCATETAGDISDKRPDPLKNDMSSSDYDSSPVIQVHSKWRSVCQFDDKEEEEIKSPLQGEFTNNLNGPSCVPDSIDDIETRNASFNNSQANNLGDSKIDFDSSQVEDGLSKVGESYSKLPTEPSLPHLDKAMAADEYCSPQKLDSQKFHSREGKLILVSPKDSPGLATAAKQEEQKATKPQGKACSSTGRRVQSGSSKASISASDALNRLSNQMTSQKNKLTVASEKSKATLKTNLQMNDSAVSAEQSLDNGSLPKEHCRLEVAGDKSVSSLIDSKFSESFTSMKHLIAAAQAKRRQAQPLSLSHESLIPPFISTTSITHGRSPSPAAVQPFMSGTSHIVQQDARGLYSRTSLPSPSAHSRPVASQHQLDSEEYDNVRVSSGHRAPGGSLSGGTEAAVARDAFEGMIETLSRTKESIGRATRLAIDCAKYGIASEVVELLIQKLENEPSFHRRVDLFFLVDSITQCSHSQKGIAGAAYIPTVQAALPRLLGAAAPPGAGARENRRQCLKVLRLWLERKILPESVLRRYMDDIGGSNDDMAAGVYLRRPSRAERAVDDPIREMEGMLVDEYGSNATFQLPGLLSINVFEDEEDLPRSTCKEISGESPVEPSNAIEEPETCAVTPSDKRHHILEDVDGELEMEDVSGSPKDERPATRNDSSEPDPQQQNSDRILDSGSDNLAELPPLPPGSPPLPLESPPPPPPLPPSPPPPPPPPPPPSSPSPPPPPPPPPLPPPPLQQSQPPPLAVPPRGHPASLPPQSSIPPQMSIPLQPSLPLASMQCQPSLPPPSLLPQPSMPPQPSIPSSTTQLVYQQTVPQEYCRNPLQMLSGGAHPGHANAAVKSEMFPQQSPCFVPTGAGNTCDPSGFSSSRPFDYGHKDMYFNPQSQPNQQFQPANAPPYTQRPYHPGTPAQTSTSHLYPNPKPTVQQHMQQSYPRSYSLPSIPNGRGQYISDEQWRMPSSDFNPDSQSGMWVNGGRPPCSGPPFSQEGYLRPPAERPSTNNMGYQHPVHNPLTSGAPIPGHGVGHMLPCRPDVSAINCWRPA